MIGNNVLLDTNIVVEFFKGNVNLSTSFTNRSTINIPIAVLGELYLGAYRSSNPQKHLAQVKDFLKKCNVLVADEETANIYALTKTELLNKGKPFPENDIWIAATSIQYGFSLVTRDKHFDQIDSLITETL